MAKNNAESVKKRCAVYTRKSSEEGLEQEFNSLHAQRDAAEAYILSQKHEGWVLVPDDYDDGGYSGGNIERPALQRLLRDVRAGLLDIIVVYKVDRLSRSLADFAQLVDLFDQHRVSFVSVTQQFNTTSSMGRLTLNILLSFAQFEREVTSERIRDKFLLSKKKGMWMGGNPPLGYDVVNRKLLINRKEASVVRLIFEHFAATRSIIATCEMLNAKGYRTKQIPLRNGGFRGGIAFAKNAVYRILRNRIYMGEIGNKGEWFPAEHTAIISNDLWAKAVAAFDIESIQRSRQSRLRKNPSFLKGLLFGPDGHALSATSTRKQNGKLFRYYVSYSAQSKGYSNGPLPPLSASVLEKLVLESTQRQLASPELLLHVWEKVEKTEPQISIDRVRLALNDLSSIWEELFTPEKRRLIELLIHRIDLTPTTLTILFKPDGIDSVVSELSPTHTEIEDHGLRT
ncbi:recombinase family protein [Endozoicomonas numazuensis]|uniref:recombinase family protein n=1 Tax=Endozoicomonas numazuensis TaxID=1137799 RepID=UPI00054CE30E|nr:recombinase family protein [Endozoicomonas numazuensis]